ncbi:MAG: branched-chain amino acid ABC transporter permease [Actinomycetota bacterium]|jgi:branched-chain amino acid transport system permease protein|uniref:branched-chain amino acid ABC transporter permease n=1 Tax=Candidatus Planktophila sp. TaxID=2175601 RepID=UPI002A06E166|nr:branched-chain amino acid ABC transporter permease [Actinomycetota bacterium]
MFEFINTLLIGITSGSIYSLMAIAIVLVWRSTRVVNFAAGGVALASTFVGATILESTGSFWIALPIGMLAGAALSSFIEYFFLRPLLKRSGEKTQEIFLPIIATLGILGVIKAVLHFIYGDKIGVISPPLSDKGFIVSGESIALSPLRLMILGVVLALMITLTLIFQRTNLGLSLRAASFAPEISRLSGIRVDAIRTLGWAISGAAGATAGILQTTNGAGSVTPEAFEFSLLLVFGFVAAVIGGIESLVGAVIGGVTLGIILAIILMYVGGSLVFFAAFIILILVLLLRPNGIIGVKGGRRA